MTAIEIMRRLVNAGCIFAVQQLAPYNIPHLVIYPINADASRFLNRYIDSVRQHRHTLMLLTIALGNEN